METMNNTIATILSSINGATICGLTYVSEPKMNKRGNPFIGRVLKVTDIVCQFGYNYQNAVNNRAEKNGFEREFIADSLPWGEWVIPNKLIEHKGEMYARFYTMQNGATKTTYYIDGRLASEEEVAVIKSFIPARKESEKQAEYGVVENQVKPFNPKVSSIISLRVNGVEVFAREQAYATR